MKYRVKWIPSNRKRYNIWGVREQMLEWLNAHPNSTAADIRCGISVWGTKIDRYLAEFIARGIVKVENDDEPVEPKSNEIFQQTAAPEFDGEIELDATKEGPEAEWFRAELKKRVIGQDAAVESMVAWFRRWRAELNDVNRPISSMLLLGPTGTGKTRLVEAAAEILHGSPKKMIKIDCGEFQHGHEIAKLAGSPPGYLGHNETKPRLAQENIDEARGNKYAITFILFDEIEKACEEAYRILLGILDKATFTSGSNKTSNLSNCVIVMTSNLGAKMVVEHAQAGAPFEKEAIAAARSHFSPEFWNRIDSVTVYEPLSLESVRKIVDLEINKIADRITQIKIFSYGEDVTNYLANLGYSPENGARFIRRALERELLDPITRIISSGQLKGAKKLEVKLDNQKLRFFASATAAN